MARSDLPTTTYIGSPSPTVIRGTMKGPPPKPNIDDTIAMRKPPRPPRMTFTLNSWPQNSTVIYCPSLCLLVCSGLFGLFLELFEDRLFFLVLCDITRC